MTMTQHRDEPRTARDRYQWDQLCEDIARVLHVEPHQIERVTERPGRATLLDVTIGGKDHIVGIHAIAEAKREAIMRASDRSRRAAEDIYARAKRAAYRDRHPEILRAWQSKWGTGDRAFGVEADGTIDLHPSQYRVVKVEAKR